MYRICTDKHCYYISLGNHRDIIITEHPVWHNQETEKSDRCCLQHPHETSAFLDCETIIRLLSPCIGSNNSRGKYTPIM